MGLVCFLSGMWFRIDAPSLGLYSRGVRRVCVFEHENVEGEERTHPQPSGLVLYGHTCLSRVPATVQCMTMFKGTVGGQQFAKGIHAVRHATIPVKTTLPASHSMFA